MRTQRGQGVEQAYVATLRYTYKDFTVTVILNKKSVNVPDKEGTRQSVEMKLLFVLVSVLAQQKSFSSVNSRVKK